MPIFTGEFYKESFHWVGSSESLLKGFQWKLFTENFSMRKFQQEGSTEMALLRSFHCELFIMFYWERFTRSQGLSSTEKVPLRRLNWEVFIDEFLLKVSTETLSSSTCPYRRHLLVGLFELIELDRRQLQATLPEIIDASALWPTNRKMVFPFSMHQSLLQCTGLLSMQRFKRKRVTQCECLPMYADEYVAGSLCQRVYATRYRAADGSQLATLLASVASTRLVTIPWVTIENQTSKSVRFLHRKRLIDFHSCTRQHNGPGYMCKRAA